MRPTFDETFLEMVKAISKRSTCIIQQVGAVLTKNNRCISLGYNGRGAGLGNCCDVGQCAREGKSRDYKICLHAEQNALMFAARHGISTIGTTMYTNTEPCITCSKLMVVAGVERVVVRVGNNHRKYGDGVNYLKESKISLDVTE